MKVFVSMLLIGIGLVVVLFIGPRTLDLPKIGKIEEWPLTSTKGEVPNFNEKPKLLTFFYTNCPDICPTTIIDLQDLQQLLKEKGVKEDQYMIVLVTLDPTFDTNERINQYKEAFDISSPNWVFLRGSNEATKTFTQYFNFTYDKNQNGLLTHSTTMYVVDENDLIRAHHDMAVGVEKVNIEGIAENLIQLINAK